MGGEGRWEGEEEVGEMEGCGGEGVGRGRWEGSG